MPADADLLANLPTGGTSVPRASIAPITSCPGTRGNLIPGQCAVLGHRVAMADAAGLTLIRTCAAPARESAARRARADHQRGDLNGAACLGMDPPEFCPRWVRRRQDLTASDGSATPYFMAFAPLVVNRRRWIGINEYASLLAGTRCRRIQANHRQKRQSRRGRLGDLAERDALNGVGCAAASAGR